MRIPSLTRYAFIIVLLIISACSSSETSVTSGRLIVTLSPVTATLEINALGAHSPLASIKETSVEKKDDEKVTTFELAPGTYTLSISAEGYQSKTSEKSITAGRTVKATVKLDPTLQSRPQAVFSASPERGRAPLRVTVDASESKVAGGTIERYQWDFGDGSSGAGVTAEHIYKEPGTYPLTLKVTDETGQTHSSSTTIVVSSLPKASFEATPLKGDAPLEVKLDASASSAPGKLSSYRWDFGNGHTATGVEQTHIYREAGSYTLSLTVTDDEGVTATQTKTIFVNAPPTVKLTATPTKGKAPLKVSFDATQSSDSDGKLLSYSWDFGDGHTAEGALVEHTYLAAGAFEAVVSVTDDQGSTRSSSEIIYVDVEAPQAAFSYSPKQGTAPLELSFDGSSSSAGTNDIVSYAWDFGDGKAAEGKTVKHRYEHPGVYTVRLTITDSENIRGRVEQSVKINGAPTAQFSSSVSAGQAPLKVSFDAAQSSDPDGDALSYTWLLDNKTVTGQRIGHTFTEVGEWQVKLTVKDALGASHTASRTVTVSNAPPKANFTATPESGFSPLNLSADASSSSDPNDVIKHYTWDFGDGSTGTGKRVTHTYQTVGSYTLSLSVTDSFGASSSISKQVTVKNRPPTAMFSLSKTKGKAPLEVRFDASESFDDSPNLTYHWDFGGGVTKGGKTATHTFSTVKQHSVKLTVTDSHGAKSSQTQSVTVTPSYRLEPLSLSNDGRSLRSGSDPFFWMADTAWLLWSSTDQADVIRYLDDARAKGFNVIQVFMSAVWSGNGSSGENAFGDAPYIDNDPTRLNPAYFDYVEWVIDEAAKRGLYIMVAVGEPGRSGDARIPYRLSSNEEAYSYGRALGDRFKQQTFLNNIVWTGGQDYDASSYLGLDMWSAIAEGIADGVNGASTFDEQADYSTTFMAFHPNGSGSSSRWFHDSPWLDINGLNNWKRYWHIVPNLIADWQLSRVKPTVCLEQSYEFHNYNGEYRNDWHVRFQGYWCALAGSAGYAYGHLPGYRVAMHEGWFASLQSPGRLDMIHLKKVLSSRALEGRRPDQSLIVSDRGTPSTDKTYIAAARANNRSYAFVYSTQGLSFDLDLTKLGGTQVKAQWFDPREGTYNSLGTFAKGSSVPFDPPGEPGEGNDWLLVLDAVN